MIKLIAAATFALAFAVPAQALPRAPLHQPDSMITQVAQGCGIGRYRVNGVCVTRGYRYGYYGYRPRVYGYYGYRPRVYGYYNRPYRYYGYGGYRPFGFYGWRGRALRRW